MDIIDKEIVESMLNEHNKFFISGETRNIEYRIAALKKLKSVIKKI